MPVDAQWSRDRDLHNISAKRCVRRKKRYFIYTAVERSLLHACTSEMCANNLDNGNIQTANVGSHTMRRTIVVHTLVVVGQQQGERTKNKRCKIMNDNRYAHSTCATVVVTIHGHIYKPNQDVASLCLCSTPHVFPLSCKLCTNPLNPPKRCFPPG